MNLRKAMGELRKIGYNAADARARVCQDVVLLAISKSNLSRNTTIKGGVVMRSLTENIRRATQDIDIDFIRYSLSDDSIDVFFTKINCLEGVQIKHIGEIEELSQQDYKGKRVYVRIIDDSDYYIDSKIDFGVHKYLDIEQEEYCFDISFDNEGASLLINSKEQMFAEKLRSLLKFGVLSTRYKDIFDMYYHCDKMDIKKLSKYFDTYIFSDVGMREKNMEDVKIRVASTFGDLHYKQQVDKSDKRWLDDDIDIIFEKILCFLDEICVL